jgi:5-methylcytosine-specific restriction endonuclease McrA
LTCTCCVTARSIAEFPPDRRGKYGVERRCVHCKRAKSRALAAKRRSRGLTAEEHEKKLAQNAAYYQRNKVAFAEYAIEWQRKNPEKAKASAARREKRYRERHPDRRVAAVRSWATRNRETLRASIKARYHRNPAPWVAAWQKRRAAKLNNTGSGLTAQQWLEILEVHDHRCAYCLAKGVPLEVEHVIALCRGGEHSSDNIVPACEACNSSKRDKSLLEIFEPHLIVAQRMAAPAPCRFAQP